MLLALFVFFALTAAVLLLLGYVTHESLYSFIGFFLIFTLGNVLIFNVLEYENGHTQTETLTYSNSTGAWLHNSTSTTQTPVYTPFIDTSARILGLCLAFLGGSGFAITWFNWRPSK